MVVGGNVIVDGNVVVDGNPSGPGSNDRRRRPPGSVLRRDKLKHAGSVEEIRDGTGRKPRVDIQIISHKSPIPPDG